MRSLKLMTLALVFAAMLPAANLPPSKQNEVIDRILAQESVEMRLLRQYAPLVETYIQYVRADKQAGDVPDGDKYFLGRAELAHGVVLEPLHRDPSMKRRIFGGWGEFFTTEFVPGGFLQMIYLDMNGFDRLHYNFVYVGREFLGEVRCLVFDIRPLPKSGKGRFVGRIWVEDQDYHIVRFNGIYGGPSLTSAYYNFDSWRMNAGKDLWLPAFVYTEGPSLNDPHARTLGFRAFRAQTRLWGYDLNGSREEQEMGKVLVEKSSARVLDPSDSTNDYSPAQAQHSWDRMAEVNVTDRLERQGLVAPPGEVDHVLETVAKNLEITNYLDIQPEIRCRVLMTSTLESFTVGHTIVLSRGLIDVLPDEASLAAILAHEMGHVVLRHPMDTHYAFFDHLQFDDKGTFRHFEFARTAEEEQAANQKGMELLRNSPYIEKSGSVETFLEALRDRSKDVPNLVSPHLGNRVMTDGATSSAKPEQTFELKPTVNVTAALPIGGRVKVDPWNDQLMLLKTKSIGAVAEDEKKPFQITPFVFYLTRQVDKPQAEVPGGKIEKVAVDPEL